MYAALVSDDGDGSRAHARAAIVSDHPDSNGTARPGGWSDRQ
ncbi:hypothetical protein [Natronorubrum texcoconense]|nr:hypothetical protein [Natronorubrum texcoconense]